jgi:hypothetical protein
MGNLNVRSPSNCATTQDGIVLPAVIDRLSPALRGIYRFLQAFNLDCDINHRAAYVGSPAEARSRDGSTFHQLIADTGLSRALAYVLGISEADVEIGFEWSDDILQDDPLVLSKAASAYHNGHPLRMEEALRVWFCKTTEDRTLVFLKLNHLAGDALDAVHLFKMICGYLTLEGDRLAGYFTRLPEFQKRFSGLPVANLSEAEDLVGEVPSNHLNGVPVIAATGSQLVPLRDGLGFDEIVQAVLLSIAPALGDHILLHYPFIPRDFRRAPGCYTEIKPLAIKGVSGNKCAPEVLRQKRRAVESLGCFDASELAMMNRELTRNRTPRIVISDTSFFQHDSEAFAWLPTDSRRTFDDMKFYLDRTCPGRNLLKFQWKKKFMSPPAADDVVLRLTERIGS